MRFVLILSKRGAGPRSDSAFHNRFLAGFCIGWVGLEGLFFMTLVASAEALTTLASLFSRLMRWIWRAESSFVAGWATRVALGIRL
jgi:hypothetical protein